MGYVRMFYNNTKLRAFYGKGPHTTSWAVRWPHVEKENNKQYI